MKGITPSRPRTSSGILWAGVSQGGRVVIQFLGLVVLSRLLPASDFGVVALASIVTNFALLLRDMGTSIAVIQREELSEGLLDTIFWFNVAIGVILSVAVVLISFPASLVFAEPRLQSVMTTLAISFPLGSLAVIHQALLERGFRFQALARIELAASMLGLAGGMFAAWKGAGAYSLVLMTVITVAISSLLLWIVSPWRPSLRWNSSEFRSLGSFSGNLVGFQIVNYFSRNADTMLIGRFLGAESLGWYNMAYKLMLFPIQNLSSVIGRALLPVLSRTQNDHASLRAIYLNAVSTIAVITCPLMIGLWVLREPFVLAVLGDDWIAVPAVLAWLAPVGLAQSLVNPVGLLYIACGKTDLMFRVGVGVSSVIVLGMAIGMPWGIVGVAAGYAIANLLILGPCAAIPSRLVGLRLRDFLRAVAPPLTASVVMGVAIWAILSVWKIERQSPAMQLIVLALVGMALFMTMAVLFMRPAIRQVVSIMKDSIKGMPIVGELARRLYRRYLMPDAAPFTGAGK